MSWSFLRRGRATEPPAPAPPPDGAESRLAAVEAKLARLGAENRMLRRYATQALWHAMDRDDAAAEPSRRVTCPICGRQDRRDALEHKVDACIFGGGRLERYVCTGCGCIFGPTKFLELPAPLVDLDYGVLYTDYSEADSTEREIRAFDSLGARPGVPYLNWGCGRWTRTIPELRGRGHDVWGYEPAPPEGERAPFVVHARTEITARFDGIFSNNVIEHMLDPVAEFRYFHDLLLPGGRMAHASPCYRYAYAYTRFHVVFLTGDAPQVLAERTGFRLAAREEEGDFINCVFERI
jgi:hypothetical protein